jgi:hypothetical protein
MKKKRFDKCLYGALPRLLVFNGLWGTNTTSQYSLLMKEGMAFV